MHTEDNSIARSHHMTSLEPLHAVLDFLDLSLRGEENLFTLAEITSRNCNRGDTGSVCLQDLGLLGEVGCLGPLQFSSGTLSVNGSTVDAQLGLLSGEFALDRSQGSARVQLIDHVETGLLKGLRELGIGENMISHFDCLASCFKVGFGSIDRRLPSGLRGRGGSLKFDDFLLTRQEATT